MRANPLLLLGAAALLGCARDPLPQPASAAVPAASLPATPSGEPIADRVFTLPASTAVANAPAVPSPDDPAETCLTARWDGAIGNCIEPSLEITDTCNAVVYSLAFDACSRGTIDVSGLAGVQLPPISVWMRPAGTTGKPASARTSWIPGSAATAIRGRIDRPPIQMTGASFDIELDFPGDGGKRTVHLVGRRSGQ